MAAAGFNVCEETSVLMTTTIANCERKFRAAIRFGIT